MNSLSIYVVQDDPVVGDIEQNLAMAVRHWRDARAAGADLVVFSELFISGYPPEDLVLKPVFVRRAMEAAGELAAFSVDGPGIVTGCPFLNGSGVGNAVLLIDDGRIQAVRFKHHLPNYGVFDEVRVFEPGPLPDPVDFRGVRLGLPICEDIWWPDVCSALATAGAEILIAINGSPFDSEKCHRRMDAATARVRETGLPLVYVNQAGGQDELVFDGASFACNPDGIIAARFPSWKRASGILEFTRSNGRFLCRPGIVESVPDRLESIYQAMVVGLRDYVTKNGFPGVLLGLSGGVDSALTAAVAVDALGPERVHAVMLPYVYTSGISLEEASATAGLLGIRYDVVPIAPAVDAIKGMLSGMFAGRSPDLTEENLQSRVRGTVLMAISNKFGSMVVTTGNKSESSVGYATIYGDMCGGYSVLKDVYKTDVFALCRYRNNVVPEGALGPAGQVIPDRTIDRPPSAELRPDQRDEDSLPPYDKLDRILELLVEGERSLAEICDEGFDPVVVERVERLLYISEYKRRQAAPGVKISSRNFGRDRRYPITNRFRDMRSGK
ncbi:NAD+ synthase [Myxococcota bacterium]|nr:NAD+ synthase [Myxococcota bacterium]